MAWVPSNSAPPIAPPGMLFQVPPVLPGEVDAQPGTRKAKANMARPCSGRFTTCLVSMVSAITLDSVSTRGDSPSTVTVSCVVPIFRTALMSVVRPVCTWTSSNTWVSKPVLAIESRYRPKATLGKENSPLLWVAPFMMMLVPASFNCSVASGTAAPAGSVTVTLTWPTDPVWLYAAGTAAVKRIAMPQHTAAHFKNSLQRLIGIC